MNSKSIIIALKKISKRLTLGKDVKNEKYEPMLYKRIGDSLKEFKVPYSIIKIEHIGYDYDKKLKVMTIKGSDNNRNIEVYITHKYNPKSLRHKWTGRLFIYTDKLKEGPIRDNIKDSGSYSVSVMGEWESYDEVLKTLKRKCSLLKNVSL